MSVQMEVLVDLCTHSSGEESAGQRSPAEDADLVDEDGRREDRHEETERQEKICRAGVMSIEPLGGLFEIREDAGMQMEEVDGECGSSHLVYPLAGEVQPRCGGQDEQGAEDDVRGTVRMLRPYHASKRPPPHAKAAMKLAKAGSAMSIPAMRYCRHALSWNGRGR